jgi:hypothetical protein
MSRDDYFGQQAVRRRVMRRYRRRLWLQLHVAVTVFMTGFLIAERIAYYTYLTRNFSGSSSTPFSELIDHYFTTHSLIAIALFWLTVMLHLIWVRLHARADREIDAEMRQARDYDLRRYELERDRHEESDYRSAYRLGDDGEWFDDINQSMVDAKPKRRLNS